MKQTEHEEVKLKLGGMLFTWNDEKEKINIRKHDVDFDIAASAFLDTDAIYEFNSIDEYSGEERWDVIGSIGGNLLMFVVYVERIYIDGNDILRIISARRAEKEERIRYVNGN